MRRAFPLVLAVLVACITTGDGDDVSVSDHDGDGFTPADGDCHDNDASVYPGAPETNDDGVDSDCDGEDNAVSDTGS